MFAPFNALIIDSFFIFEEQRSLKQSHTHFSYRSKFFIRYILLVRPRKLIARCAILPHEPKITEATFVSSPPRSPPSEGFHLATTFRNLHNTFAPGPQVLAEKKERLRSSSFFFRRHVLFRVWTITTRKFCFLPEMGVEACRKCRPRKRRR